MYSLSRAFEALSHEARLAIVRLLIPVGPVGLSAGTVGEKLGLAPNVLSFHLGRLANVGLIRRRRQGRNLYYAVDYGRLGELVGFFAEDCCAAAPEGCLAKCPPPEATREHARKRVAAAPAKSKKT